ncbi:Uncharacterised protein [Clostridium tertium]|uniref:Uncharacterized protein n=1 Tax=Clostridium tertium TaxID=1559 RepID=A0A6N2ZR94_9CLOT
MDEESSKIIDPLGETIKLFIRRDSVPLTS